MSNPFDLTGKTAIVTGANTGLGQGMAVALAEAGADVALVGRSRPKETVELVEKTGRKAHVIMADLGSMEPIERIVSETRENLGEIDILVNNAGIIKRNDSIDFTEEDWDAVMDINLNAPRRLAKRFLPGMIEAGWGRIVNFTGMNAMRGHLNRPHVSTSKHGILGLTRTLAVEFGQNGVTTNAISPGPIASERDDPDFEAHLKKTLSSNPTRRQGTAAEVSAAVRLLVSDQGAYINGQMIQVNGGAAL